MAHIRFDDAAPSALDLRRPLILVFTEGTLLGPAHWFDWFNHRRYVPIGACAAKLNRWASQGAEIAYLTSQRKPAQVEDIAAILLHHEFPGRFLFYRGPRQRYAAIAEELAPDVLVEDDCRSLGGAWQMTITRVRPEIRQRILSVVVKEFAGIDHLPDRADPETFRRFLRR